ncbi:RNA-directed DNA polymerase, eukaryota, reverse transcriptase zinc-binding domain protein [Tanacetum coccineum]
MAVVLSRWSDLFRKLTQSIMAHSYETALEEQHGERWSLIDEGAVWVYNGVDSGGHVGRRAVWIHDGSIVESSIVGGGSGCDLCEVEYASSGVSLGVGVDSEAWVVARGGEVDWICRGEAESIGHLKPIAKFGFPMKMVKWIMACVSSSAFSICLNGVVHGYFNCGKGLRQRDPISPYLFKLVMEKMKDLWKLSRNLWKNSVKQVFSLTPNLGKSTIFFGNKKDKEKQDLLEVLPFKCGKLLVRYLGVPLLAKTLGIMDCKVLIDKVDKRNKTLSYAGRIQLLVSNSSDSAQGKARVARMLVCKPKDQGGLVFYDKWYPNDHLCEFITKTTIYDARIQDDLVIADMVVSDNGKWPDRWLIDGWYIGSEKACNCLIFSDFFEDAAAKSTG